MKKITIPNLIIEITRKCNLSCRHCLQGNPQNLDIDIKYIDTLLAGISEISIVTFTGGEPFLNPTAIQEFIRICKNRKIRVSNFYIATNGTICSPDILHTIIDLYYLCKENEVSCIEISNDKFHTIDDDVVEKLSVLRFVQKKYDKPLPDKYLLNEGRAHENGIGKQSVKEDPYLISEDSIIEGAIYLNCNGDIIKGCNFSYINQEEHKMCHVNEFHSFIKKILKDGPDVDNGLSWELDE